MILKTSVLFFGCSVVVFFILFIIFGMKEHVLLQSTEYVMPRMVAITDEISCFDQKSDNNSLPEFEYELKGNFFTFFTETVSK